MILDLFAAERDSSVSFFETIFRGVVGMIRGRYVSLVVVAARRLRPASPPGNRLVSAVGVESGHARGTSDHQSGAVCSLLSDGVTRRSGRVD